MVCNCEGSVKEFFFPLSVGDVLLTLPEILDFWTQKAFECWIFLSHTDKAPSWKRNKNMQHIVFGLGIVFEWKTPLCAHYHTSGACTGSHLDPFCFMNKFCSRPSSSTFSDMPQHPPSIPDPTKIWNRLAPLNPFFFFLMTWMETKPTGRRQSSCRV